MLTLKTPRCKSALALTACLLPAAACTTVETQSFRVGQESVVDSAQVATDADFSRYSRLHAVEMGIFFPEAAETPAEDIQRIRDIFRNAFLAELDNYVIVTEPGPGAMTVQATLIDFRNATHADRMSVRADLRDSASPGKILFLMEMRDSVSDQVLARASDSAGTPTIASSEGAMTDWTSVEDAAGRWASLFRQFLDENFGN